jgi:hypothetical protein
MADWGVVDEGVDAVSVVDVNSFSSSLWKRDV